MTEQRIARFLCGHAIMLFVLAVILFMVCLAGLSQIKLRNDYRAFFNSNDEIINRTDWLSSRLGSAGESVVLIYRPADGDVLTFDSMLQFRHVAGSVKAVAHIGETNSWLSQEKIVARKTLTGHPIAYAAVPFLLGVDVFSEQGRATLKRDVRYAPTVWGRYIARDFTAASVVMQIEEDSEGKSRENKLREIEQAVRDLERDLRKFRQGDRLYLAGGSLFDHASTTVLRQDARRLFPAAILLVCFVIFVLYRSLSFTFLSIVLITLPVIATAGLAAWLKLEFSTLSISALLLVGTLAVADVLHVANSYFINFVSNGDSRLAVLRSFEKNFWAISATSGTTIIGEIALLLSASPPVRVMGQVVILGVLLAWLSAVMMLPLVLRLTKPSPKLAATAFRDLFSWIAVGSVRWPAVPFVAALALVGVATFGLTRARVDDSMTAWFSPATEFRQSMDVLDKNFLSSRTLSYAVGVVDADHELAAEGGLDSVTDSDLHRLNEGWSQNFAGRWLNAGEAQHALDQRLASQEVTGFRLADDLVGDQARPVSSRVLSEAGLMTQFEPGKKDYLISYYDPVSRSTFKTLEAAKETFLVAQKLVPDRDIQVQGLGLAFAALSVKNFWNVAVGSFCILLIISLALVVVFRSVRLGALAFLPNIVPVFIVYGFWSLMGNSINMAAVSVFAVASGIVVDDTIHFVLSFQRFNKPGASMKMIIAQSFSESGVGIFATTLIIGGGFLLLGLSNFQLTAQKALLTGVAVLIAFCFDLVILPALLARFGQTRRRKAALVTPR